MSSAAITQTIALRGQQVTLQAFGAEQAIEWLALLAECGKVVARVHGAIDIDRDDVRNLVWAGVVLAGMALGDQDLAASLTEDERKQVIAVQDELNRAGVLMPLLAVEQAAARSYLGMHHG
jgi:hypothetical protein